MKLSKHDATSTVSKKEFPSKENLWNGQKRSDLD